jgi:hypothetical protein
MLIDSQPLALGKLKELTRRAHDARQPGLFVDDNGALLKAQLEPATLKAGPCRLEPAFLLNTVPMHVSPGQAT